MEGERETNKSKRKRDRLKRERRKYIEKELAETQKEKVNETRKSS